MTARPTSRTPGQLPTSLPAALEELPPAARTAFDERLVVLARVLTGYPGQTLPQSWEETVELVADEVGNAPDLLWLAHAVLTADLPTDDDMGDLMVRARLDGTWAALAPGVAELADAKRFPQVEVATGTVTCDVHSTSASTFLSGIQRVVRETASRWDVGRDVRWLAWTQGYGALRDLRDDDHHRMFGRPPTPSPARSRGGSVVVPWESTHLWVEVITDVRRTGRLLALAQHSRNEVGVLGYDSIPVTSSATVADGMTSHFARGLAAVRRADRVAMISDSAAEEFRGIVEMGSGRRDHGPAVFAVPLAVAAPVASDADLAEATTGLVIDGVPMVLVVGSHEPRKNHLAVLHAAEVLWREGVRFNLVLVGAGSWGAAEYDQEVASLMGAGRPVQSLRALPDGLLGAAYRLAHCTVFPSLNEGFGLPVAESLAVGTPVITSEFGSMRDIAAPFGEPLGCLLVDPRDDDSLIDAMRLLLTDPVTHERLVAETAERPTRTWDDYADDLWSVLVDGVDPTS